MQEGAFALIDCLGFKGIWRRMENQDPEPLIRKLRQIEDTVSEQLQSKSGLFEFHKDKDIEVNVRLLSDTVAISYQGGDDLVEMPKGSVVFALCMTVVEILNLFVKEKPHLVMRGCISYGKHLSEGNFIVGQAVDEAAEHMNIADGAFIWMLPSAANLFNDFVEYFVKTTFENSEWELKDTEELDENIKKQTIQNMLRDTFFGLLVGKEYEMPLKGGSNLKCPILNPLAVCGDRKEAEEIIRTYSEVMSGERLDIWLKKQNTMEMLEVAIKEYERLIDLNSKFKERKK